MQEEQVVYLPVPRVLANDTNNERISRKRCHSNDCKNWQEWDRLFDAQVECDCGLFRHFRLSGLLSYLIGVSVRVKCN